MAYVGGGDNGSQLISTPTQPTYNRVSGSVDAVFIEDDFLYKADAGTVYWPWFLQQNGTAASANTIASLATHPGIVQMDTGTDTTGSAGICRGESNGGGRDNLLLGGGYHELTYVCNIPTLATVSDDYALYFGLGNGFGVFVSNPGTNAVVFRYNRSVSTNWQGVTVSGGSTTVASGGSSVAVATGWNNFKITIDAAATTVSFYVNGTLIGTSTTNIPTVTTVSHGAIIKKSAGSNARQFQLDYFRWFNQLTTPRF